MSEKDKLLYTYTGVWNNNTLPYSKNYPYSIIFHPATKRIMQNGVLYGGDGSPCFIKGTNSSGDTTGKWTGTSLSITKYEEGLTIIFVPNVEGNDNGVTLNISNLGARSVYFTNTDKLTKHYSPGTPILLTYIGDESTGSWKRADSDTLKTPVSLASGGNDFYLTLTNVTSGLTDIYTVGGVLKYNYVSQTLYSPYFNGHFIGDLQGNATSADKLKVAVSLWGQQFDGTTSVSGDIINTGVIKPSTNNSYNIGTTLLYYDKVFGNYFIGRSEGVRSHQIGSSGHNPSGNLYLLTHNQTQANANTGTGEVEYHKNYYISTNDFLRALNLTVGNSNSHPSNCALHVSGASRFEGNITCSNNAYIDGKLGVGNTNPAYKLDVTGGGRLTGDLIANSFIKNGGTIQQVLLANGSTKEWSTSRGVSTIVARDANDDIYTRQYYSDINDETLTIGSIYVSKGSADKAIRKVSLTDFMDTISASNILSFEETLTITDDWQDTGITTELTNFPQGNGTYIVQIDATSIANTTDLWPSIYSGVMTIYNGTNSSSETDEVVLHRGGHASAKQLYLRTISTVSSAGGYSKIQIASSINFSKAYLIKFKFKKII